MELQGRVIVVMEPREGTSARGPWKSQQYVIETHDQYPKKMVFDIFGADRIDQFAIKSRRRKSSSASMSMHTNIKVDGSTIFVLGIFRE